MPPRVIERLVSKAVVILYPEVGHAYTPEMRAEMLAWFAHWLQAGKPCRGLGPG